MRAAIEQLAQHSEQERSIGEPAHLELVARTLGAIDILYLPIIGHGYTQWKRGGPVIHLSLSRSDGRRRFLLAHECGHLIFDRMLADDPTRAWREFGLDKSDAAGLEHACNEYANELLIPTRQLRAVRQALSDLDSLRAVAKAYRVSLTAMIYRLNRLGGSRTLLNLRCTHEAEWVITDRIGAPTRWQGSVDLGVASQKALSSTIPVGESVAVTLELVTRERSSLVVSQVHVSTARRHAVALFDTSQLPV